MIYLQDEDIHAYIQIRLKDESQADFTTAIDEIEANNIELIRSYLASRFDVALIFDENAPIIDGVIKRILAHLVIYDLIRRNAARKVPTDYREDYNQAMKDLQRINSGELQLGDLPGAVDEDGNTLSNVMWTQNRNENFFI